jgi:hypothetical protein
MWYRGFKIEEKAFDCFWIEAFQKDFKTEAEAKSFIDGFYSK